MTQHSTGHQLTGHNPVSIDTDKGFAKIQHSFMIKSMSKLDEERSYLNIIKAIYNKCIVKIVLSVCCGGGGGGELKYILIIFKKLSLASSELLGHAILNC